jgi:hypothetical protein
MIKILLLAQVYFNDGSYHLQNFPLLVREESECREVAEVILPKVGGRIRQVGYSCTDKSIELDFWPIPERIPTPRDRT